MAFTKLKTTQKAFVENYLRGTDRTLTFPQAASNFGIKNLRAVISNMRNYGLIVDREYNTVGRIAYSIPKKDYSGSTQKIFS